MGERVKEGRDKERKEGRRMEEADGKKDAALDSRLKILAPPPQVLQPCGFLLWLFFQERK